MSDIESIDYISEDEWSELHYTPRRGGHFIIEEPWLEADSFDPAVEAEFFWRTGVGFEVVDSIIKSRELFGAQHFGNQPVPVGLAGHIAQDNPDLPVQQPAVPQPVQPPAVPQPVPPPAQLVQQAAQLVQQAAQLVQLAALPELQAAPPVQAAQAPAQAAQPVPSITIYLSSSDDDSDSDL